MSKFQNDHEAFRNNFSFYVLLRKVIYIWVGFPDFRAEQVEYLGLKGEKSHFFRAFEDNTSKLVGKP